MFHYFLLVQGLKKASRSKTGALKKTPRHNKKPQINKTPETNKQSPKHLHNFSAIPLGFQVLPCSCAGQEQQPQPSLQVPPAALSLLQSGPGASVHPITPGSSRALLPHPTEPKGTGAKQPPSTSRVPTATRPFGTHPEDVVMGRKKQQHRQDTKSQRLQGQKRNPGAVLAVCGFEAHMTALEERMG